jgi:hypothetical protein
MLKLANVSPETANALLYYSNVSVNKYFVKKVHVVLICFKKLSSLKMYFKYNGHIDQIFVVDYKLTASK